MKITRENIEKLLSNVFIANKSKNIIDSGEVKNIQIFGNDIELDISIQNPTLQFKKKVESQCLEVIKSLEDEVNLKINFFVELAKQEVKIQGEPIAGVDNIIAVSSGKGGVGKSTITANLAVSLSNLGYKVGVLDADIYGPSMHIMFGLEGATPSSVEVNGKNRIKPLESHGVKLLSIGFFAQNEQAVVWRGPMASKALNQLLLDAHWGDLDYLIVDLPPGTGDIHLSLVQAIPLTGAIVVSTPQPIALADAKKGINMFTMDSINVPVLGIVENMAYFTPEELPNNKYYIFGREGAKILSEQMDINLLAEIPIVQSVREAADAGRPAVLQDSTSISIAFLRMGEKVVESIKKRNINLAPTQSVKLTQKRGCSND